MNLHHETPSGDVQIWHGDALAGLPCEVDCLIADPPYSERTHVKSSPAVFLGTVTGSGNETQRRELDYMSWTPEHVAAASLSWHEHTKGWIVIMSDSVLTPVWERCLAAAGRYVFAPLPFVSPGSRVRLAGDGPSSWTCWVIVARPRHKPYSNWGTLPGAYICPPERMPIVGGKPRRLMLALVNDYSRPGDLVADPCCGAGTTLWAAQELGRRAVGVDISLEHCELAAQGRPIGGEAGQLDLLSMEEDVPPRGGDGA